MTRTVDPLDEAEVWKGQERQHPRTGPPGLMYSTTHPLPDVTVDVILYRNRRGHLVGLLYHYPHDITPSGPADHLIAAASGGFLERAGNMNVFVRPDRRRRGIGLLLTRAAARRWPLNFDQQSYTPAGEALARRYAEQEGLAWPTQT